MRFLGIDPGLDGAVVLLGQCGKVEATRKTPIVRSSKGKSAYDIPKMVATLIELVSTDTKVLIEKTQPMPKMMGGASANYQRGLSLGLWTGILTALQIPYIVVPPQTWQKKMLHGVNATDTKQAAYVVASRLWPAQDWRRTPACQKADEGYVDAALIARFGMSP